MKAEFYPDKVVFDLHPANKPARLTTLSQEGRDGYYELRLSDGVTQIDILLNADQLRNLVFQAQNALEETTRLEDGTIVWECKECFNTITEDGKGHRYGCARAPQNTVEEKLARGERVEPGDFFS